MYDLFDSLQSHNLRNKAVGLEKLFIRGCYYGRNSSIELRLGLEELRRMAYGFGSDTVKELHIGLLYPETMESWNEILGALHCHFPGVTKLRFSNLVRTANFRPRMVSHLMILA